VFKISEDINDFADKVFRKIGALFAH